MTQFLEGTLMGFVIGGVAAFFAFNAVTKKMAERILEANDERCPR